MIKFHAMTDTLLGTKSRRDEYLDVETGKELMIVEYSRIRSYVYAPFKRFPETFSRRLVINKPQVRNGKPMFQSLLGVNK